MPAAPGGFCALEKKVGSRQSGAWSPRGGAEGTAPGLPRPMVTVAAGRAQARAAPEPRGCPEGEAARSEPRSWRWPGRSKLY